MVEPIPLSFFVDFMLTAGSARLAAVRQLKEEKHTDFYRPVRDTIVDMHQKPHIYAGILDRLLDSGSPLDQRERRIFPKVVTGYQRFLRAAAHPTTSAAPVWFEPPMRDWPLGPITVHVAPELGLLIRGQPHVIQLYFRGEPPSADYISTTTSILSASLGPTWPGTTFALLDVRRAKLYPHRPNEGMEALLRAEAAALASLLGTQ